jgi:ferredoxin
MPNRPGWLPQIDTLRCTGCGWCVAACAPGVLSLETVHWHKTSVLHDAARCTGCSLCAVRCPFHVISMHRQPVEMTP